DTQIFYSLSQFSASDLSLNNLITPSLFLLADLFAEITLKVLAGDSIQANFSRPAAIILGNHFSATHLDARTQVPVICPLSLNTKVACLAMSNFSIASQPFITVCCEGTLRQSTDSHLLIGSQDTVTSIS